MNSQEKLFLAQCLRDQKHILFAPTTSQNTQNMKRKCWQSIVNILQARGIKFSNDAYHLRDVTWSNMRKRTLTRLETQNMTGNCSALDQIDYVVLDILDKSPSNTTLSSLNDLPSLPPPPPPLPHLQPKTEPCDLSLPMYNTLHHLSADNLSHEATTEQIHHDLLDSAAVDMDLPTSTSALQNHNLGINIKDEYHAAMLHKTNLEIYKLEKDLGLPHVYSQYSGLLRFMGTTLLQVTNVSPLATKDQLQTLFGFIGDIDDLVVYPSEDRNDTPSRVCYVRFKNVSDADVALHLFNTVFLDRALIIFPVPSNEMPTESYAYLMRAPADTTAGVLPRTANWPVDVISMVIGKSGEQLIHTLDARMCRMALPTYPPLPSTTDANRVEEIRKTVLVTGLSSYTTAEQVLEFFTQAGEVRYVRLAGSDMERAAYVEFTEQPTMHHVFNLNGALLNGQTIKIQHSNCAIIKPANLMGTMLEAAAPTTTNSNSGRGNSRSDRSSDRHRRKSRSRHRSRSRSGRRKKSRSRSASRHGHSSSRRRRSRSSRSPSYVDRRKGSSSSRRRRDEEDERKRSSRRRSVSKEKSDSRRRRSRRTRSRSDSRKHSSKRRSKARDDTRDHHSTRRDRSSDRRRRDDDKTKSSSSRRSDKKREDSNSSRKDNHTSSKSRRQENDHAKSSKDQPKKKKEDSSSSRKAKPDETTNGKESSHDEGDHSEPISKRSHVSPPSVVALTETKVEEDVELQNGEQKINDEEESNDLENSSEANLPSVQKHKEVVGMNVCSFEDL